MVLRLSGALPVLVAGAVVWALAASADAQSAGRQWTWVSGGTTVRILPTYPPALGGTGHPGSRRNGIPWVGADGSLNFFGGFRQTGITGFARYTDEWKFDTNSGTWQWMAGPNTTGGTIVYPPAHGGVGQVGARTGAGIRVDTEGNIWMMGGWEWNQNLKNDLWKRDAVTGEWTWLSGSNGSDVKIPVPATIGDTGQPASGTNTVLCVNREGDLLTLGGAVLEGSSNVYQNYRWKYDVSANEWIWLGDHGQPTVYPSAPGEAGEPGERVGASYCLDADGHLWMYGGSVVMTESTDLWKFDIDREEWLWIHGGKDGHSPVNFPADYGEGGHPGARNNASMISDLNGDLWLFGGTRSTDPAWPLSNDLWRFSQATQQWIWEGGSQEDRPSPAFPAAHGQLGYPGYPSDPIMWMGTDGNLWLYGGFGRDHENTTGDFNAMWKLELNPVTAAKDWQLWDR